MADNVNTATYYLSMDLSKLDPNEAKKVTRYAVGNSISNNVTVVELVEVKQEGKDVTEHFNLEKDGSKAVELRKTKSNLHFWQRLFLMYNPPSELIVTTYKYDY